MKKKLPFLVLLFIVLTTAGCRKCYYCHNSCKVCQDTHFYILIQSDQLSTQYYNLYIDSLTSPGLGWTCRDTVFTRDMQVCAGTDHKLNSEVSLDEQAGWTCTPISN
jgi:hypothetical protein